MLFSPIIFLSLHDMKIAVYCSANRNIDPDFFTATDELGKWMGSEGHTLVYGGCNMGLMECIGKACKESGAMTIGIIPTLIESTGRTSKFVDVEIPCENLSDRKDLMLTQSDIAIALPGGIGTLDEILSMAASHTIGYHQKKIILYNLKGFWNPFIQVLDDLQQKGFIRGDYHDSIEIASSLEDIQRIIADI